MARGGTFSEAVQGGLRRAPAARTRRGRLGAAGGDPGHHESTAAGPGSCPPLEDSRAGYSLRGRECGVLLRVGWGVLPAELGWTVWGCSWRSGTSGSSGAQRASSGVGVPPADFDFCESRGVGTLSEFSPRSETRQGKWFVAGLMARVKTWVYEFLPTPRTCRRDMSLAPRWVPVVSVWQGVCSD